MLPADRWITLLYIASLLGWSYVVVQRHVVDFLQYSKVYARWVTRALAVDHTAAGMMACLTFLQRNAEDGREFLECFVTGVKTAFLPGARELPWNGNMLFYCRRGSLK